MGKETRYNFQLPSAVFVYWPYAIQRNRRKFAMLLRGSSDGILSRRLLPYGTGGFGSSYGLRGHDLRVSRVFGSAWQ
jgi:hypothetical protein